MSANEKGSEHYKRMAIEPWDVIDTWPEEQRIGFYRGNLLKYTLRLGSKDAAISEAKKASHYAEKLVETLEQQRINAMVKNIQGNNLAIQIEDNLKFGELWSESDEHRMRVVMTNGNDGLVYDFNPERGDDDEVQA